MECHQVEWRWLPALATPTAVRIDGAGHKAGILTGIVAFLDRRVDNPERCFVHLELGFILPTRWLRGHQENGQ
jgi:hypothetical protein